MHQYFLQAALEQAWLGRGQCAPNPSVGAVAVHQGQIIARAYHQGAGLPHAEQLLLQQLPVDLTDIHLYVTLEPCNHWGKTPPCVDAIAKHGQISQVIYGYKDPNPIVCANNSPRLLNDKGINTIHYALPEINAFYQSYHYWTKTKKPWVTAKIAQSLDGKIAARAGERSYLTNQACSTFTHKNRLHTDIILTTAKTIQADNPLLNARGKDFEQSKALAIIDSRLSLTQESNIFKTTTHCHIFHDETVKCSDPFKNCSYHLTPSCHDALDLDFIINKLGEMGYHDVWVEAGGKLFTALHQENLVQRTYIYLAPMLLGPFAIPAFTSENCFIKKPQVNWQIMEDNVIACLDWQEE